MRGHNVTQPWDAIPSALKVSDRQIDDLRTAQRINRFVYSKATVTNDERAAATRVLKSHGADDLAEMLGLTP